MKTKELKQRIEKIKRESCVATIQEVVKTYTGQESKEELEKMLEQVDCEVIKYRINNLKNLDEYENKRNNKKI